jgi:uncharacterized protein (DUF1697 family)
MPRYAVLLRGVNLGRHRRLPMADLRRVLTGLGYDGVATYLQSGNAALSTREADPERLAARIREALVAELGVDTAVLIRAGAELAAVVDNNPFPEAVAEPKRLMVVFLSAPVGQEWSAGQDPAAYAPDEFRVGDRVVYLRYAGSPLDSALSGLTGPPGVIATTRNWNTVTALARLTVDDPTSDH